MHPQGETAEMVKQHGQEGSPEDIVIDAALETCLAEHANNLILPMLQSLSTEEKSLSGRKMKCAVWSGQHSPTECNWIGMYHSAYGEGTEMALAQPQAIPFLRGDSRQIPSDLGVTLKFLVSIMVFLNMQ